ncbi:Dyp-type peroxidase [Pseudomonas sp. ABC1]|uniref:Dyp-type peroxidase n=1 Tax=Pseudomonas sp. ABC1 TaxID=2748080 RepID=UPI0015C3F6F3|nr:Dyp-type peroxidase [Pseudomonas sp. ABC1]QLF94587.1 Dyp-type peroxidase [Pseudomonas sp. ABC1]
MFQAGIHAALPSLGRHLFFRIDQVGALAQALDRLGSHIDGEKAVLGIGQGLAVALEQTVPGLRVFPEGKAGQVRVPSTPSDLWVWLRGEDHGDLFERSQALVRDLAPGLALARATDVFRYKDGHDLTGYEDGTENPEGDAALAAAFVLNEGEGLNGSSFVAVQQWQHDFPTFDAMPSAQQDNAIGRRKSDNEELDDAPESAHVKRTAQEDFEPEAFVLRRSMPWMEGRQAGLMFVAFGKSFDAFEAQLHRMSGEEDGIVDALYQFTRPLTGAYFWCPPMHDGRLDLRVLGW